MAKRIAIVEDETAIRENYAAAFRREGYLVDDYEARRPALEAFESRLPDLVVIDEAHVYRGVFGSQVGCVLRRLRRVCALYGSEPQFVACSATIANPAQHLEALFLALTAVLQGGAQAIPGG